MAQAYAPGTVDTYEGQIRIYLRFATDFPERWRWTDYLGGLWVKHCLDTANFKKNTLMSKISAFKHGVLKYTGRSVDSSKGSVFQLLNRAIARRPDDVERKRPIVLSDLQHIWQWVLGQPADLAILVGMIRFMVTYACMLRSCEVAALNWEGIVFQCEDGSNPTACRITLLVSEGEIYKTHSNAVTFNLRVQPELDTLCVVKLLWKWRLSVLQFRGALTGVVFPDTVDKARHLLKELCHKVLNYPPKDSGLHSLRAGAASDAEKQNKTLSEIMFMGRWRSPTVLVYLRNGQRAAHELNLPWKQGTMIRPSMFSGTS
jgi:hypothetical protein